MSTAEISTATRDALRLVSTATLCTALFKVGLRNQYIHNVRPLGPQSQTMVGQAYTLRYIPAREDLNLSAFFWTRPIRSESRLSNVRLGTSW